MLIDKLLSILQRDFLAARSYRIAFLLQFVGPIFLLLSFFFLARLLQTAVIPDLDRYGGDYFAFALVGIIFTSYVSLSLGTAAGNIRAYQASGTLEVILTTRTGLGTVILGSSLYSFLSKTIFIAIYLLLAATVFGVDFSQADPLTAFVALAFMIVAMLGLGMLSASFILLFKRGDPVTLVLAQSSFLLSGVIYPVAVLPDWLQVGSSMLPHTYALEALRLGLLQGYSVVEVAPQLGAVALFALAFLPLGYFAFQYALDRARVEGSLGQF